MSTTTTRTRPSIWTELHREWEWLVTRPAARSAVVDWSTSHPVFSDAETLQDIADIVSRSSGPAIKALLSEHYAGHPLATRVLTQCMLPKLIRSARYARTTVHERGESYFDERAQQTLGAFQDVLDEWRPGVSATAGSLGLNTLNKITQMRAGRAGLTDFRADRQPTKRYGLRRRTVTARLVRSQSRPWRS